MFRTPRGLVLVLLASLASRGVAISTVVLPTAGAAGLNSQIERKIALLEADLVTERKKQRDLEDRIQQNSLQDSSCHAQIRQHNFRERARHAGHGDENRGGRPGNRAALAQVAEAIAADQPAPCECNCDCFVCNMGDTAPPLPPEPTGAPPKPFPPLPVMPFDPTPPPPPPLPPLPEMGPMPPLPVLDKGSIEEGR